MKRLTPALVVLLLAFYAWEHLGLREQLTPAPADESELTKAYENRQSDLQVRGRGEVLRELADDNDDSRHQRFILQLESGQTVLIAHNIDLAPRIDVLRRGDTVEFFGEYEWNQEGGVVHWTHRDPQGRHVGGWLRHNGRTYH